MPPLPPPSSAIVDAVIVSIAAYLAAHPLAADSVDGVARWWLPRDGATPSRGEVEQALERLSACGELRSVRGADGTVIYSHAGHGLPH